MQHYDFVTDPQLLPVPVVDDDATGRASGIGWLCVVVLCAAMTAMDKEIVAATNLLGLVRHQIERAGPVCALVHDILAECDRIGRGRQWSPFLALVVGVQVALALPTVAQCVYFVLP